MKGHGVADLPDEVSCKPWKRTAKSNVTGEDLSRLMGRLGVARRRRGDPPAAGSVEDSMLKRPVMSWINAGELAYVIERKEDAALARRVLRSLRRQVIFEMPTVDRIMEAATIKAGHRLTYADAFAVATAVAHDAILFTGDPEIINGDPLWNVEDLR
jgi:predicted nucleic acid-binding protein